MDIYNYHPETGEYLGGGVAALDPLETRKAGLDVFLLPANATTTEPPEPGDFQWPVWTGAAWELTEDHRGVVMYSTATGEVVEITELGPIQAGLTDTAPGEFEVWDAGTGGWVVDLAAANAARVAEIDAALAVLDAAAVRPLRAIMAAEQAGVTPDPDNVARLADIEADAVDQRGERAGLA